MAFGNTDTLAVNFIVDPFETECPFTTDADLARYAEKRVPANTLRKQRWAVHLFESWRNERNSHQDERAHVPHILEDISDEILANTLAKFIKEVAPKKSSTPYAGRVLH